MSIHRALPAIAIGLICSVQPQSGTGAISGTVLTLSSGTPVAEASVTLSASVLPGGRVATTTDTQGHFQFTNLASGRYSVTAIKKGLLSARYGERTYGRGGRAIPLGDREHRDITLQLPQFSSITGRIVHEGGSPAMGATVHAVKFSLAFTYRRAMTAGSATTDRNGVFRIDSLYPDEYVVCATTRETAPLNEGQQRRQEIDRERRGLAYWLGPTGIEEQKRQAPRLAALEAQLPPFLNPIRGYSPACYRMIALAPGEDRGDVDMQFVLGRLARIEGTVTGMPANNLDLDLIWLVDTNDVRNDVPETTRPNLDGRFFFTNVPPGRYTLFVHSNDRGPSHLKRIGAAADIVVADEDIRNVALDLHPGVSVSGHLAYRGGVPPTPDVLSNAGFEIRLEPQVPGPLQRWPSWSRAIPDAAGRFVFEDVFPEKYRVSVIERSTTGWLFDPAAASGGDDACQNVEVKTQDVTGLTVTLTQPPRGEILGTIMTEKGAPAPEYSIVVYPSDVKQRLFCAHRVYVARPKEDGTFVVGNMWPGSYRLATLLDARYEWFDPDYLRRIDPDSMPVSIANDQRKVLNLRVRDR
jgi:hypothetical protein